MKKIIINIRVNKHSTKSHSYSFDRTRENNKSDIFRPKVSLSYAELVN